jgi:hypothetical protein
MAEHRVLDGARSARLAFGNRKPYALRKLVRAGPFGGEDDRQLTARLCRVLGLRIAAEWVPRPLHHPGLGAAPLEPGSGAGPY